MEVSKRRRRDNKNEKSKKVDSRENDKIKSILFYGSERCPACRRMKKPFEESKVKYGKRIIFNHVDVDQKKIKYDAIPYFIAYEDDKEVDRFVGADEDRLNKMINRLLK